MEQEKNKIALFVLCFVIFLVFFTFNEKISAKEFNPFTPFGGKILKYTDNDIGCSVFTKAIWGATGGVVNVTVPAITIENVVGGAGGASGGGGAGGASGGGGAGGASGGGGAGGAKLEKKYGMLRIEICLSFLPACYEVPLNFLPTLYLHEKYKIKKVQTLGTSFELCNLCDKLGELAPGSEFYNFGKMFCKTEGIKQVLDFGCNLIGKNCAATNIMIKLGTGLIPDTSTSTKSGGASGANGN